MESFETGSARKVKRGETRTPSLVSVKFKNMAADDYWEPAPFSAA
jgi:hypothetical protein